MLFQRSAFGEVHHIQLQQSKLSRDNIFLFSYLLPTLLQFKKIILLIRGLIFAYVAQNQTYQLGIFGYFVNF